MMHSENYSQEIRKKRSSHSLKLTDRGTHERIRERKFTREQRLSMINLKNFREEEFSCPCCGACNMSDILLTKIQALRDMIKVPLPINSGFRCELHNAKLKGASSNSQHLLGKAVDISTEEMTLWKKHELMKLANGLGFNGIGVYPSFFHLDIRDEPKLWVR